MGLAAVDGVSDGVLGSGHRCSGFYGAVELSTLAGTDPQPADKVGLCRRPKLIPTNRWRIPGIPQRFGKDVDFPQDVGAIIENVDFIPYLNAYDNLYNLAAIRHRITKEDVKQVLETVGLGDTGRKKVAKFSLGMRQRLAIAQAIMEKPKLIILDEPMNVLDKRGVEEMRQIFLNLKAEGTTILLASHNMEDIRCLCDKVYEMDAGVLTPIDGVS